MVRQKKKIEKKVPAAAAPEIPPAQPAAEAPKEAPKTPEFQLSAVTSTVLNNRGRLGALRTYNVGDFCELNSAVRKVLESYGPLEAKAVHIGTKYGVMNTPAALEGYRSLEDKLQLCSNVSYRSADGKIACSLYIGRPEDVKEVTALMGEDEVFMQALKRFGKNYGKDIGIIVGTSLIGGVLGGIGKLGKIAKLAHFTGRVARTGGLLYGLGDMTRNTYNEFVPAGVCTVVIEPNNGKAFTPEEANRYRAVVDQFEKYKTMEPQEKK
jgi:hypothetical protein